MRNTLYELVVCHCEERCCIGKFWPMSRETSTSSSFDAINDTVS